MIVLDVWGGDRYMCHIARYIVKSYADMLKISAHELENGNLINLRKDLSFQKDQEFDLRRGKIQ